MLCDETDQRYSVADDEAEFDELIPRDCTCNVEENCENCRGYQFNFSHSSCEHSHASKNRFLGDRSSPNGGSKNDGDRV